MKSKISFFNVGISKNLLRRCWPLWTTYFAVLIISLPIELARGTGNGIQVMNSVGPNQLSELARSAEYYGQTASTILNNGVFCAYFSAVVAIICAMAMFSYLYDPRGCGMMASLPVRRETTFLTVYFTGLVPLLLANVLTMLLAMLVVPNAAQYMPCLLKWLALVCMSNLAFYGFAVFCAMLTGKLILLPIAYGLLLFAVYIAEGCIRMLLSLFVYGFSTRVHALTFLSPIMCFKEKLFVRVVYEGASSSAALHGMGIVGAYCAAGVLFSVLALVFYRTRHMEKTNEAVSMLWLKTVFKYCMAGGCAVVLPYVLYDRMTYNTAAGFAAAMIVLAMLVVGAFIGYFAAEMIMQKTVRVFAGRWRGYIILCCIMALLVVICEMDVFGYERYIPDVSEIKSVYISNDFENIEEEANLVAVTELHRKTVADKNINESAEYTYPMTLKYFLKDGRKVIRRFVIDCGDEAWENPDSDIVALENLCNSHEAVMKRAELKVEMNVQNIVSAGIDITSYGGDGAYDSRYVPLSEGDAVAFYQQCMLPDYEDGKLGKIWLRYDDDYYNTASNISISIELRKPLSSTDIANGVGYYEGDYDSTYVQISMNSERCVQWLWENLGIRAQSIADVIPAQLRYY